jgi:hypothetical protein
VQGSVRGLFQGFLPDLHVGTTIETYRRKEFHNLYLSPDIIRQVKSRRMSWAGHVARMGEERKVYKFLVGNPE